VPSIVIGGLLRLLFAFLCFAAASGLLLVGLRLGWGLGWMAWIPAAFLLLLAPALCGRRRLTRCPAGLEISDGRFFRRIYTIGLGGGEVEILPAGGAWTVVLHVAGRELPLACWVRRSTAESIVSLLGDLPRRPPRMPQGDR
jgi:hypothetical protein